MWSFSSYIFIGYANWANERIKQQICWSMERKSPSRHHLLCLVLFRIETQGDFSLHCDQGSPFQVAMGQTPRWAMARFPVLVWGIGLSVFIVFVKVIDIYKRVDEGLLINKPWELMLKKWSSRSWKFIKESDLMYGDSDWREVRDIRGSCSWVLDIRVFRSSVSLM